LSAQGASTACHPAAVIFGCEGPALTADEVAFFCDCDALGLILFQRNVEDPAQVRALVQSFRDCVGRADAPVLIDQEGGRVARLTPPHWRLPPPAARCAALALKDPEMAAEASGLNARLIAADLFDLGITVACAPVLDLPQPGADPIISDRAAGTTASEAETFGRAACEGFLAGGVLPVIKHIPGHGRALVDSHKALPRVDTPLDELDEIDFQPFRSLNDMPWAMTGHVIYEAVDPELPTTLSSAVVGMIIRGTIGFNGFLLSDDICMEALIGPMAGRASATLNAGCDAVLHCSGDMIEMTAVATGIRPLTDRSALRFARGEAMRQAPEPFDSKAAHKRLDVILERASWT
jgi:beta-N-acetylhexosaminidase